MRIFMQKIFILNFFCVRTVKINCSVQGMKKERFMKIAVIDGQGGGIGKHIMEKLRAHLPEDTELIALGTNSLATAQMIKANALISTSSWRTATRREDLPFLCIL